MFLQFYCEIMTKLFFVDLCYYTTLMDTGLFCMVTKEIDIVYN